MAKMKASPVLREMRIKAMALPSDGKPMVFGVCCTRMIDGVVVSAEGNWGTRNTLDGPQQVGVVRWFVAAKRSSWAKVVARFGVPA